MTWNADHPRWAQMKVDEFMKWVGDRDSEIQAQLDRLGEQVDSLAEEFGKLHGRVRQVEFDVTEALSRTAWQGRNGS